MNVSALQIAFMLTGTQTNWCHSCVWGERQRDRDRIIICMCIVYMCDCGHHVPHVHVEVRIQLSGSLFSLHAGFLGSKSSNQLCVAGPCICSAILLVCFLCFETKTHCGMAGLCH